MVGNGRKTKHGVIYDEDCYVGNEKGVNVVKCAAASSYAMPTCIF